MSVFLPINLGNTFAVLIGDVTALSAIAGFLRIAQLPEVGKYREKKKKIEAKGRPQKKCSLHFLVREDKIIFSGPLGSMGFLVYWNHWAHSESV